MRPKPAKHVPRPRRSSSRKDWLAILVLAPLVWWAGSWAWGEYTSRVAAARAEGKQYSIVAAILGEEQAPLPPEVETAPTVVVTAPKPEAPAVVVTPEAKPRANDEPVVAVEGPYPFQGAALTDPRQLATLVKDTAFRIADGKWETHLDRLERGLVPALKATARSDGAKRYDRLWQSRYFALGASQQAFIRRATPATLRSVAASEDDALFLRELMADPVALETWLRTVKKGDDVQAGLRTWSKLWRDDPKELKGQYLNLQVAMAVVYDRPMSWRRLVREPHPIDPLKRYRWYRDHDAKHHLETDLTKLQPYELVWVVAADVSEEEMEWTLKELRRLKQATWGQAYGMIRYRMDFVTGGKPQGPEYTDGSLADILKCGGICMHQAHFAASTAKSVGIPAAYVTGEGNRGGHAWFAFLENERRGEWNMSTGRYADGYSCGMTGDPQTGQAVKEFEVQLLGDKQRRSGAHALCRRLMIVAGIYAERAEDDLQLETLRLATEAADRTLAAWEAYTACLESRADKVKLATWKDVVRDIRSAFDEWPDMRDLADDIEARHIAPTWSESEAFSAYRAKYHRMVREFPDRMDLILRTIQREAAYWERDKAGNFERIRNLYRETMREHAGHLPTFKASLEGYYQAVKGNKEQETFFLNDIERTFYRELGTDGDVFRMKTVAPLLETLKGYFAKCGQEERARNLERDMERIQKKLDKLKKQ